MAASDVDMSEVDDSKCEDLEKGIIGALNSPSVILFYRRIYI